MCTLVCTTCALSYTANATHQLQYIATAIGHDFLKIKLLVCYLNLSWVQFTWNVFHALAEEYPFFHCTLTFPVEIDIFKILKVNLMYLLP